MLIERIGMRGDLDPLPPPVMTDRDPPGRHTHVVLERHAFRSRFFRE
jgi:hypothetical protein